MCAPGNATTKNKLTLTEDVVYGYIPSSSNSHHTCTHLPCKYPPQPCTLYSITVPHYTINKPHCAISPTHCTPSLSALPQLPLQHTLWAVHGRRLASCESPGRPTHVYPPVLCSPPPLLPTSHLQGPHPPSYRGGGRRAAKKYFVS